jgi:hypothetical protein
MVPPFDCMAQDHWGYYNKSSIVNIEDANPTKEVLRDLMLNNATYREPSAGAAKYGLLKSVETPFGGKLTFEYEQNDSKDADSPSITKIGGGVRVMKTIASDGINTANDIVTSYYYRSADGSTSGWGFEQPVYLNRRQIKIWNASNLDGYTNGGKMKFDVTYTVLKSVALEILKPAISVLPKALAKMFMPVMPLPQTIIFNIIMQGLIQRVMVLFNPNDYIWSNSYSFLPYQAQNPIGINYSRVEIAKTSLPGGSGKVVSEFTCPASVRSEIPALSMPYSPKQRFASWKYGLPSKESFYNQNGSLIKEITSSYSIVSNVQTNENHKSQKVEVVRPESAWCWVGAQSSAVPLTDFSWEYYYPIAGSVKLTGTTEKNFSPNGIVSQTNIVNSYNADNMRSSTESNKSNGDIIKVKMYYANDYNNISSAIQDMKTRRMLAVPVSTESWIAKPNGDEYLVDATINQYDIISNGEIKIKKVFKLETKQPLLKSIIGEQSASVLVRNSTYFKEKLNYNYDNNGLLTETTTPELKVNSQIYDYNDRFVTADVINAYQNEIAYSSFETAKKGSWNYDISNILSNDGVTGRKYFHFPVSQTFITRTISGSKSYILSLWSKGTGISVTKDGVGVTLLKIVPNPVTGWTYSEYSFSGAGNVSIGKIGGGSLDLDEVRLYPSDARMTTTTYAPGMGKTSECDINNRVTFYQYDGLNRLVFVKDDRKNILKKICYNYAGEPENCIDLNDNTAQWRPTGITSCEACPANANFNSGVRNRLEIDMNPASPTYNSYRWALDPTGTCPTPPSWVTSYIYCEQLQSYPYGNSGNQITVETDINPCSQTYNQTRQTSVLNTSACPPTIPCNTCNAPEYKCISGQCIQGQWKIIAVQKVGKFGPWECTYAYCFPDGTTSKPYVQTITSSTACTVDCY